MLECIRPFSQRKGVSKYDDLAEAAQCPWLDLLTDRELKCLENVSSRQRRPVGVVDLSQSGEKRNSPFCEYGSPCVTPKARLFCLQRNRLLTAVEKCALQGIRAPQHVLRKFGSEFLSDLAGNAFCAPMMLVVVMALLCVSARNEIEDQKAGVVEPAEEAAQRDSDASSGDSDGDSKGSNASDGFMSEMASIMMSQED